MKPPAPSNPLVEVASGLLEAHVPNKLVICGALSCGGEDDPKVKVLEGGLVVGKFDPKVKGLGLAEELPAPKKLGNEDPVVEDEEAMFPNINPPLGAGGDDVDSEKVPKLNPVGFTVDGCLKRAMASSFSFSSAAFISSMSFSERPGL